MKRLSICLSTLFLAIFCVTSLAEDKKESGSEVEKKPDKAVEKPCSTDEPESDAVDREANLLFDDFSEEADRLEYRVKKHASGHEPVVIDGRLQMLTGGGKESNSIAWDRISVGLYRSIKIETTCEMTKGARGMSLMLLNTNKFGISGAAYHLYKAKGHPNNPVPAEPKWDEPNLWGSFAVALDTHNPPNKDPFNEWGNVNKRPQREVSLHYNNTEVANVFCEADFVNGEEFSFNVSIDFVCGGAEISVSVGDSKVYEKYFIAHMMPFESRFAVGAEGPRGGTCNVNSVRVKWGKATKGSPSPITLTPIKLAGQFSSQGKDAIYDLLPSGIEFERVIMTFRYTEVVKRDEWDRIGWSDVYDGDTKYELARIITPFRLWGTVYEWHVDVSDFSSLLTGKRRLDWGPKHGFSVDILFTYYPKPEDVESGKKAMGLSNLWNGTAQYNEDKKDSIAKVYGERTVTVPEGAKHAKIRICVTGHGGKLEFTPAERSLKVGDKLFENVLWTTDCYLNPYRYQFGTWKYSRAGWGPGSIGRVWEIDVSDLIEAGKELKLVYTSQDFTTESWDNQKIESQIVFYK